MPDCTCPNCKSFLIAPASAFGQVFHCGTCGFEFTLDVAHLAHFKLPQRVRVQLRNPDGTAFAQFPVPIWVEYGYSLPPLRSDELGQIVITREMFAKANRDEVSTDLMGAGKNDYSLTRYIRIRILSRNDAIALSQARATSGWEIMDFEKELYGDLGSLIAAYVPSQEITPVETRIDLSQTKDIVDLELAVQVVHQK